MLEARNLHKEYKTKNGPVVKALDGVSIKFEETGMVFILGKSGSGKSTLLNVLGGLDSYDDGEVLVKGKSSKDFKQADFDSYRNTFIGFIFQDYNILEEFTISKNIGLALELQGKKADKDAIEELMEQVDLKGYGKRKPNTLSGGQRQRVAIARALVKNPEIIMADEPTGALDSNTGKQVLDTLKKLSKTKLVLIVSHDREFAEYYGDRIIELADGKIISDVTKYKSAPKDSDGLEIVDDKILTIKKGVKLDAKKTKVLNEFIANTEEDVIISVDSKANKEFRKFAMIDEEGNKESFKLTENLDIKDYDPNMFKLIRSKLPGSDSLKMGASGLKAKPIRLFFTIILSAIAFAMFGLADTMGSYDKIENTIRSIEDSKINYASFSKKVAYDQSGDYVYYQSAMLSQADFDMLNSKLEGYNFVPVFGLNEQGNTYYTFEESIYDDGGMDYNSLYRPHLYGFVEVDEDIASQFGTLLGESRLPSNDDEIMLTKYSYDVFAKGHYKEIGTNSKTEILDVDDLLGKKINVWGNEFTLVGILDTNFDSSRYQAIEEPGFGSAINDYLLQQEFNDLLATSAHAIGYLNKGWFANNREVSEFSVINNTIYFEISDESSRDSDGGFRYLINYNSDVKDDIVWVGESKTTLADNEVIISIDSIENLYIDVEDNMYHYNDLIDSDYINLSQYFESTGVANVLQDEYDQRVSDGTISSMPYNDYVYNLQHYLKHNYFPYQHLDLTDAELDIVESAETYIINKIMPYIPTTIWLDYKNDSASEFKIVGYYTAKYSNSNDYYAKAIISNLLYNELKDSLGGIYNFAISKMDYSNSSLVRDAVEYTYSDFGTIKYELKNPVMTSMEEINGMIETLSEVFLYVGIGFAVFASLLLLNFITISISYKKREIGVLRAIGARGMDVFKIFFNEAFIIAFVNFILASIGSVIICMLINNTIRTDYGMLITILNIGIRQFILMFGVSLLVAFVSSFFPVYSIAKKKPIDAIRNS